MCNKHWFIRYHIQAYKLINSILRVYKLINHDDVEFQSFCLLALLYTYLGEEHYLNVELYLMNVHIKD